MMVLAKGVVHVEVLPEELKLDGEGMAEATSRLPKVLRKMLGKDEVQACIPPQAPWFEGAVERAGLRL